MVVMALFAYLWLVGNGRMVVIVVMIDCTPFLHSLLTKDKFEIVWRGPWILGEPGTFHSLKATLSFALASFFFWGVWVKGLKMYLCVYIYICIIHIQTDTCMFRRV